MQQPIFCAIIGAGSIGGLIDNPQSPNIASHAHAIAKHPLCKLVAICEPSHANQEEFIKRWGKVNVYASDEELLDKEKIDLLIIASPTPFHHHALQKALHVKSISYILCEKPLVATSNALKQIKPLLLQSKKKILINLIRTFDPSFQSLAKDIQEGRFGKALYFQGIFTKGLLHNGIHMLGVLVQFFEKIENIEPLDIKHLDNDISGNFKLTCKNAEGILACIDTLPYSDFELTIWLENGKIEIKDGGNKIEIFTKKLSILYEGYYSLTYQETLPNTLQSYALHSLDFLLTADIVKTKEILEKHIIIHKKIFDAIEK